MRTPIRRRRRRRRRRRARARARRRRSRQARRSGRNATAAGPRLRARRRSAGSASRGPPGRRLASSAIPVPTARLTTIVRVREDDALARQVDPVAFSSALSPTAIPSPRKSPMTEPMIPTTTDSSTTDQSTCRREAPSVRKVASSRRRCATVIASVFAITKLPTKSATPPKPSRKYLMKFSPCWVSLESASPARRRT